MCSRPQTICERRAIEGDVGNKDAGAGGERGREGVEELHGFVKGGNDIEDHQVDRSKGFDVVHLSKKPFKTFSVLLFPLEA